MAIGQPAIVSRFVTINLIPEFWTGDDDAYRVVTGIRVIDGNAPVPTPTLFWRNDDGQLMATEDFHTDVAMGQGFYRVRDDNWTDVEVDNAMVRAAKAVYEYMR